jgi:hypothetical protein
LAIAESIWRENPLHLMGSSVQHEPKAGRYSFALTLANKGPTPVEVAAIRLLKPVGGTLREDPPGRTGDRPRRYRVGQLRLHSDARLERRRARRQHRSGNPRPKASALAREALRSARDVNVIRNQTQCRRAFAGRHCGSRFVRVRFAGTIAERAARAAAESRPGAAAFALRSTWSTDARSCSLWA